MTRWVQRDLAEQLEARHVCLYGWAKARKHDEVLVAVLDSPMSYHVRELETTARVLLSLTAMTPRAKNVLDERACV